MKNLLKTTTASSAIKIAMGSLAIFAAPNTVLAQIDEVVVTAQRAEENLQDVPVAITSISTEQLENRNIQNVLDLQNQIPNISIATGTGTSNSGRIFLRGVGEDESRGAVDTAVGVYVDGVFVSRSVGALFDVVDLERIEVLRGPQGTLYGRSTNGGAIKLVSIKPQQEQSLSAKVTYGNNNRLDLRGTANYALSDSTAVRLTGMYRQRDGFFDINPNGVAASEATEEVGDLDTLSLRGQLSQDFGENWNVLIAADYTDDKSDPIPSSVAPDDVDGDLFTVEPQAGVTCSQSSLSPITAFDFRPIGCFNNFESRTESQGISATITGELGDFTVQSITAHRKLDDFLSSHIGFAYLQETDQEQTSQELTLSSNYGGPFNFVIGGYYFSEDMKLDSVFVFPHEMHSETESFAGFGQVNFDVSDRLTLTGGIRYTDETKDYSGSQGTLSRVESADFNNTSFTVKADYDLTENALVYASYSTGFKSGGWSPDCFGAAACFLPVDEEKVATIETGLKSQIWDNRLRFNATYFNNQYDNLQIAASVPGLGFTRFNVDESKISGLEFEMTFAPTDRFEMNANLGLLDAKYTSITDAQNGGLSNNGAGCANGVLTPNCALDLDLKNAPDYKASIAALYKHPLAAGELAIGGDISFEAKSFSLVANTPSVATTDIPPLLNARVAFTPNDSFWNVAVWAKNITDEHVWRVSAASGSSAYASEPATYGIDFGFDF
ncbi:iron complex outermembrane receptor protein [Litorimonas taeanensis]|uniref:Iron complex outermembrane receptor protein n=1 Tax=Litorimonas taeanensis TaxID=568099 RepID=A0A420WLV0_9PROT|nr:TonB-dependent receptor [Litorimonas taeanensis]RKQ71960.1 iron complex outermembrane receptor protein [Litorimonas taeanensis]